MAKDKKSFVAYADWNKTFEKLSDEEAGRLAKMMFSFVSDENPEAPDRITELLFEPIKGQLERDLEKYKEVRQKRAESGRNGGIKSGETRSKTEQNEANASNMKQNEAVTDTVNVNDNVTDILLEKETKGENQDFLQNQKSQADEIFDSVNPETEKEKKVAQKKEKAQPPDLDTFVMQAKEIYQNELKLDFSPYEFAVRSKYQSWLDSGWKDGNKKPILNWINKLRNTIPHLKPIYGTNNTKHANSNGQGYSNGNNRGFQSGKMSASQILAREREAAIARHSESGNSFTEAEILY